MSTKHIDDLVKIHLELIKDQSIKEEEFATYYSTLKNSYVRYLVDYRSVTIGVPRQSGKTKWVTKFAQENSALVFTNKQLTIADCNDRGVQAFNVFSDLVYYRGIRLMGAKYQYAIFDDCVMNKNVLIFIESLKRCGLLTKDFTIINIGTPCTKI